MNPFMRIGKQYIDPNEWVLFVSKPFSLFTVSVWRFCYENFMGLITKGKLSINDGIFIQSHGVVHSYRKKKDIESLRSILFDMYKTDKKYLESLLSDANQLNQKAEAECHRQKLTFEESIDLTCRVAVLGAVLPRFLSEVLVSNEVYDNEILDRCIELKKKSLYPRVLLEIVEPLARERLASLGYPAGTEDLMLVDEWFLGLFDQISDRKISVLSKKDFVQINIGEATELLWVDGGQKYIDIFEKTTQFDNPFSLKGQPCFPGLVRGRANVCVSSKTPAGETCNEGDILVTVDSNPSLISLIKKSSALVVEEVGVESNMNDLESENLVFNHRNRGFSHGAILSNELGIPCVTGVRYATSLIKTGDIIEVDATRGTIQILTKSK